MSIIPSNLALGANLPSGWGYYGCYTDYGRRKLAGPSYVDVRNMTQESCIAFCNSKDHPYAGIEYRQECYCGLVIGTGSERKEDAECNFWCTGAADEKCGSDNRLSVFYTELLDYTRTNPGPNLTSRIGCVADNVYDRTLPVFQASEDDMTVARCTLSCKAAGYSIAGVEYGRECFCGDTLGDNPTMADEGCDMRCTGNSTEFCGGSGRLDAYALNITTVTNSTNTSSTTSTCNSTPLANPFVLNGGFEEGLADWTALAYNSSSSAFDVGLSEDALEGCAALMAVPKPDSKSLSQHFQVSTTLINLQPSYNYTIDLSIGHRRVANGNNPIFDPKYTIRLSDGLLAYGAICGFAYGPCPLIGLNNSTYTTLSMPFQAGSSSEMLTVYLSWYNGNFDVPLYLDSVIVRPSPDNAFVMSTSASESQMASEVLIPRSLMWSSTVKADLTTSAPAAETDVPKNLGLTCPTPESCPDGPPPLEITHRTLLNNGFEDDLEGWYFLAEVGKFEITRTNQSLDGDFAASIKPQSPNEDFERSITLKTRMTNLNSSHEWYTVILAVGHPANTPLNDSIPWLSLKYHNDVTGDIQRRAGLCGAVNSPFYVANGPCDFVGREGALYQEYGMDTRSFLSTDQVFTNSTEMDIELQIIWPVGAPNVPVFVDRMRVWEIEWGVISR